MLLRTIGEKPWKSQRAALIKMHCPAPPPPSSCLGTLEFQLCFILTCSLLLLIWVTVNIQQTPSCLYIDYLCNSWKDVLFLIPGKIMQRVNSKKKSSSCIGMALSAMADRNFKPPRLHGARIERNLQSNSSLDLHSALCWASDMILSCH